MGKPPAVVGISSSSSEWVDPNGKHWVVDTFWSVIDGRQECVGVALRSFGFTDKRERRGRPVRLEEGVHPLRVEVLRALTMSVIEERRHSIASLLDELGHQTESAAFRAGQQRRITGPDGAPLPTDEALEEVARVYRAAWHERVNPTAAVAEAFTLSRSAAAKRVARARAAGLLPPTTQGQARGTEGATK